MSGVSFRHTLDLDGSLPLFLDGRRIMCIRYSIRAMPYRPETVAKGLATHQTSYSHASSVFLSLVFDSNGSGFSIEYFGYIIPSVITVSAPTNILLIFIFILSTVIFQN